MRVVRISLALLCLCFLISGCTHEVVDLTHEGKLVKEIEPDEAEDCKYLRQVQAFTGSDSEDNLIATLRNKVGVAGGNAYVHLSSEETNTEMGITADAYKCYPK